MTKKLLLAVIVCVPMIVVGASRDRAERAAKQVELDENCEAVREARLSKERTVLIAECVQKKHRDQAWCTRFYADHGAASTRVGPVPHSGNAGNRAPLYYDLPECVEAHEFRKSYRRRS